MASKSRKPGEDAPLFDRMSHLLDKISPPVEIQDCQHFLPSGAYVLDCVLSNGRGWPLGRVAELYAKYHCIAGDTHLKYQVRVGDRISNARGGTVERLYQRFHGIARSGKGYYQRPTTALGTFWITSADSEGFLRSNRIADVVYCGEQGCVTVDTASGLSITCTPEHKLLTPSGYFAVGKLFVGSILLTSPLQRDPKEGSDHLNTYRAYLFVKNHPVAGVKIVTDKKHPDYRYRYHRLARARAVMEARINNLCLEEFVALLNTDNRWQTLQFLPRDVHVHHKDEDYTNDAPENLEILSMHEHRSLHSKSLRLPQHTVTADRIIAIRDAGVRKTYDLCMQAPNWNYVANRFVVHNSGKTTLVVSAGAQAQKAGGIFVYLASEAAILESRTWLESNGVAVDYLIGKRPKCLEEALELLRETVTMGLSANVPVVIGWGSVAAAGPATLQKEGHSMPAEAARLLSEHFKLDIYRQMVGSKVIVLIENHVKKSLVTGRAWGEPEDTRYGGLALDYHSSLMLKMTRSDHKADGDVDGTYCNVLCAKNNVIGSGRKGTVIIRHGAGVDDISSICHHLEQNGGLPSGGSWLRLGEYNCQGWKKVEETLRQGSPGAMEAARAAVKETFRRA